MPLEVRVPDLGSFKDVVVIDLLVKAGDDVLVSVRRAIGGSNLAELQDAVKREFLTIDEQQRNVRAAVDKLESGLMSRLAEFRHER